MWRLVAANAQVTRRCQWIWCNGGIMTSSSSWMALQPLWALASCSVSWSIHNRQGSLNEWSAHRKASTETLDGKRPIILLRGPLGAWGSLTCSKYTTRVEQLKVPPGGLVPWVFPSLKIRRPPPGLNPRRSSHEVAIMTSRWKTEGTRRVACYNAI
jgi:hypothetical protein